VYLHALGWNSFFQNHWDSEPRPYLQPARVIEQQRAGFRVVSESGELFAEGTGHLRHSAVDPSALPSVGDWVAINAINAEMKAVIHDILPRRTKLSRKVAGRRTGEQVLVTNVDTAFLLTSLNGDFNPRRIERYLGAIWESGAKPVVILSKSDLSSNPDESAGEMAAAAPGVDIHVISALTADGVEGLSRYLGPGNTAVLLGPSGVGKSTLVNRLLDAEVQTTLEVRPGDDRGRHATTHRRLFPLPSGGVLIDTPGIREFQLWEANGLGGVFDEIRQLAMDCRFRDCRHDSEPGCAVKQAIDDGVLDAQRLANAQKLNRELDYVGIRRDLAPQREAKQRWKRIQKAIRKEGKIFKV
jgi:ribosome biogenesis GTPase / thiamine phosphate phosphatase